MRENICGTVKQSAGSNLAKAVLGTDQPIGVPAYKYASLLEILDQALTDDEKRLVCVGFGIGCQREKQKDIAERLGLSCIEVSVIINRAVAKLRKSPYKSKIKALVATSIEIDEYYASIENDKRIKEIEYRLFSLQQELIQERTRNATAEQEIARLSNDVDSFEKKLQTANLAHERDQKWIKELQRQLAAEKSYSKELEKATPRILTEAANNWDGFIARLRSNRSNAAGIELEELGLPSDILERLNRAKIHTVDTLTNQSPRTLINLNIGRKNVEVIRDALRTRGLDLRVG